MLIVMFKLIPKRFLRRELGRFALLSALIFSAALPAVSADAWRVTLEQQLKEQQNCTVNYLTNVDVEDEGKSVTAKAHCDDGRSFDVIMKPGTTRFEISECQPIAC